MKIILLKDVPKVGRKYEIKNISDGHALNFLIPKGLAEVATPKSIKNAEMLKSRDYEEKKIHEDLLLKNIADLNGVTIEMKEKVNEKGTLFAGIHKAEIVPALKEQTRLEINPDFIVLDKPIKDLGEHEIEVKVQDKSVKFKLLVKDADLAD